MDIENIESDPNPDTPKPTKLVEAAEKGDIEEVIAIRQKFPEKVNITHKGYAALHKAACNGHLQIIQYLCSCSADVDFLDINSWTALHHAVEGNQPEVITALLERKANPAIRNRDGVTPLEQARQKNFDNCVEALIKFHQSTTQGVEELSPLRTRSCVLLVDNGHCQECEIKDCVTFNPCGHCLYCFECSLTQYKCPLCQEKVLTITFNPHTENMKSISQKLKHSSTVIEKLRQETKCSICEERKKDSALKPCFHVFCFKCSRKLHEDGSPCPNCRERFTDVAKLYL